MDYAAGGTSGAGQLVDRHERLRTLSDRDGPPKSVAEVRDRQGQISAALESLEKQVAMTHDLIGALEGRLDTVLRPEPRDNASIAGTAGGGTVAGSPEYPLLANRIYVIAQHVVDAAERIRGLIGRVGL